MSSSTKTSSREQSSEPRCKQVGVLKPLIDRNRCEGKADCIRVCPYNVFEIAVLEVEERKRLSLRGKLKGLAHGYRQAFAVRAEECHACGLCVTACPEDAIRLVRAGAEHT